jgi:ribulose-phosphate 3-epimerase
MIKISASILAAPLSNLATVVPKLKPKAIDFIHMDVMDGNFVPQISFGEALTEEVGKLTKIPLDVHLMVNNPERHVSKYYKLKPEFITFHRETTDFPIRLAEEIRKNGIKAGIALNPGTPVKMIQDCLPYIDLILIMTVEPGFYGQSFVKSGLEKINRAKELIGSYPIQLEVDGGVNTGNIERLSDVGVNICVAGSALFKSGKPNESALGLKNLTNT